MRRVILLMVGALVLVIGIEVIAQAAQGVCSGTVFQPGDPISVHGKGALPGETALLEFDGHAIGGNTVDGFGNFFVPGNIPNSTTVGQYQINVDFSTSTAIAPCTVSVVNNKSWYRKHHHH